VDIEEQYIKSNLGGEAYQELAESNEVDMEKQETYLVSLD
jgi:hypothetical protein